MNSEETGTLWHLSEFKILPLIIAVIFFIMQNHYLERMHEKLDPYKVLNILKIYFTALLYVYTSYASFHVTGIV